MNMKLAVLVTLIASFCAAIIVFGLVIATYGN